MKTGPCAVPACHGEQQGADPDDAGQYQHQRGQSINHQGDTEGRWPVARQVDTNRAGLALLLDP
ncbi:hypothetical protein D3C77_630810 [compost metagenome]